MNRFLRNSFFYLIIILVFVGLFSYLSDTQEEAREIDYHQFIQHLEEGRIDRLNVQAHKGVWHIEGEYKDAVGGTTRFFTYAPLNFAAILEQINAADVELTYEPAPGDPIWLTVLTTFLPFLLIFILFFFLMSQAQGGGNKVMNFGKSKAKLIQEDKKKVTFKDVAGADEEKAELEEIVHFLKDPRKFSQLGARIPKGVLLVGPPGTGKTLLGRAVAGEAGVPFFSISGSDFVEMFVGVGASRVRDLFENAKKNAPCIIFIDEIDAVGRQRGAGLGGGHDEREQTLNQLLVEMDGFESNEGIIVMAATNRPDVLDPALLRPGRFDRQITVDRPDIRGRVDILKVHARNKPLGDDVDLEVVAKRTPGFAGADLENLLNEAALLAARRNKKVINMKEVDDAIDRVIAGTEKRSRRVSEKERRIVAYHESGHTIAGYFLPNADLVHKVTIVPRGQAGGYMVPIPKEERFIYTEPELKDRIAGLLGGRVAEEIVFGEVSVGATDDFRKATNLARRMVTEFGMSRLGPLQFGESQGQVFLGRDIGHERNYSEQVAYEIDKEVRRIVLEQYERCKELLLKYREKLDQVAQTLLEVETLTADEIKEVIETGKLSSLEKKKAESRDQASSTSDKETSTPSADQPEASHAKDDIKVHIQPKKDDTPPEQQGAQGDASHEDQEAPEGDKKEK